MQQAVDIIEAAIGGWMAEQPRRPLVVGVCGAQGSGKTTVCAQLVRRFDERGVTTISLSLDDLYLTRPERKHLASSVHPLLITRGPPGTHDVALGLQLFKALDAGRETAVPRFDKARDDRRPRAAWDPVAGPVDLVLFEGWCIGARPQSAEALDTPVNAFEAREDPEGVWRTYANAALGAYRPLFDRLDRLVLLRAPGFDVVSSWRAQQERDLAARAGDDAPGVMTAAQLDRFLAHYERLTRFILDDMPKRADLLLQMNAERRIIAVRN